MTEPRTPAQEELLALKGTNVLLADLLALFGARRRTYQTVPVIADALRAARLATVPSFATCGQRALLLVVAEDTAGTAEEDDAEEGEDLLPGTLPQHSFKIGDIPSARAGLSAVGPGAELSQATYIMLSKNYSQVPVIKGTSDLKGVVTWRSIAGQYASGAMPTLAGAMVKDSLPVVEVHQEVFGYLPLMTEHGYLLVRDYTGDICGIVTAADITTRFHETALPFFLVGEIEFRLRKWLGSRLGGDAIRAVQPRNRQTGDITDLMFGDYVKLLRTDQPSPALCANAEANWQALNWNTNRTQFVQDLIRVKNIRNKIAHFDSDPLTAQRIAELREFSGLLKQLLI
ncbi:CBS domain-containing protein [Streptomyces sp.]|uniref:CBS domain-containing protein n=1 Tax=Streptomyces sp. TaxID=1931 RepID=UPI002F40F770